MPRLGKRGGAELRGRNHCVRNLGSGRGSRPGLSAGRTAEAVPVPTCARGDGGGAGDPGDPGAPGHPDVPQGSGSGGGAPRVLPQVPRGGGGRHW